MPGELIDGSPRATSPRFAVATHLAFLQAHYDDLPATVAMLRAHGQEVDRYLEALAAEVSGGDGGADGGCDVVSWVLCA